MKNEISLNLLVFFFRNSNKKGVNMNQLLSFDIFFPEINWKSLCAENFRDAIQQLLPQIESEHEKRLNGPLNFHTLFSPEYTPNMTRLHICGEILYLLNSVKQSKELTDIFNEYLNSSFKKLNSFQSDSRLYHRIISFSYSKEAESLSEEQSVLLHQALNHCADFDSMEPDEILNINHNVAKLKQQFQDNLISHKQILSESISENNFDGLPDSTIKSIQSDSQLKSKHYQTTYDIPMSSHNFYEIMSFCDDPLTRNNFFNTYRRLGNEFEFNNNTIAQKITNEYHKKAKLLGYNNASDMLIAGNAISSTETILNIINKTVNHYEKDYHQENMLLKNFSEEFFHRGFKNSDRDYILNKIDYARNDIDAIELEKYFPIKKVLSGILNTFKKMFNLSLIVKENNNLWDNDVVHLIAIDNNNKKQGEVFLDLYNRTGKKSGDSCSELTPRHKLSNGVSSTPITYILCNFKKRSNETLRLHEVKSLFHEFGHALNHLLCKNTIASYSGTKNVPIDVVEIPGLLFEKLCYNSDILKDISEHCETKEPLSDEYIRNIQRGVKLNKPFQILKFAYIAHLDLEIFMNTKAPIKTIEAELIKKYFYTPQDSHELTQTHLLTHVFSGDYASNMYAYLLAEIISSILLYEIEKHSLIDNPMLKKIEEIIFAPGGYKNMTQQYTKIIPNFSDFDMLVEQYFDTDK